MIPTNRTYLHTISFVLPLMSSVLAAATAAAETSSSFIEIPLAADIRFDATKLPRPGTEFHYGEYEILAHDFILEAGEKRRVTGRTQISLGTASPSEYGVIPYRWAEVNHTVRCSYYDAAAGTWSQYSDQISAGTNQSGLPDQRLTFSNSLLLEAANDKPGLYRCALLDYASHSRTDDFYATAYAQDTFLEISAAHEEGATQFTHKTCNSQGNSDCEYLANYTVVEGEDPPAGRFSANQPSGDPREILITSDKPKKPENEPNPDWIWSASDDATALEVMGTYQITSCPYKTRSCSAWYWGPRSSWGDWSGEDHANIVTRLHLDQLNPDGSVCQANQTQPAYYDISNDIHHQPVNYRLAAPVSPTCQGSRNFRLAVEVRWESGNPVKIDGGTITVINLQRNDTTTVPNVLGVGQEQANTALQAAGLIPEYIGIIDPSAPGTVLSRNAPAATVEPVGSKVSLTVSLGSATIPDVVGSLESAAIRSLLAAKVTVGSIYRPNSCVDPGFVQSQSVDPGSMVAINTPVSLTVPTCKRRGGGNTPLPQ
ncbi:PASTA domain-containing protein [Methylomonas sp. EFPC3]|uniref:PASTA domain-containing protein n=1 Tax=Methylomonas sp. EFPC3 TaxID=3021710 RepID=UPI0024177A59|nr:PASTA domain-containing protein [Methylomonas sp. EFPC3]WFP50610.1 PASTA domain-containing protein [Methylomonas sp. EFPC3]